MRFLWRDPEDGSAVELRDKVQFGKARMVESRFMVINKESLIDSLPEHYTIDDVELLTRGLGAAGACIAAPITEAHATAAKKAGFAIFKVEGLARYHCA